MMRLSQKYLVFFGVYHLSHVLSLLGIYESIVDAPSFLPMWGWHVVLLLVYGVLPLIYVLNHNQWLGSFLYIAFALGALSEWLQVFTWSSDWPLLYLVLGFLDLLALIAVIDKF